MKLELPPMLESTEKCIVYRNGRYPIQLEIPRGSTLTDNDIDKTLHISSWEMDDMKSVVDSYEGARGVKIKKEKPSYFEGIEIPALYIAGIGYRKIKRLHNEADSIVNYGNKMFPPETSNLFDHSDFRGLEMGTSLVEEGEIVFRRSEYSPLGSYL